MTMMMLMLGEGSRGDADAGQPVKSVKYGRGGLTVARLLVFFSSCCYFILLFM
jgi:hypothetical protein